MRVTACCRAAVLLLLSAVTFFSLDAQEKKISGIIKDEAGIPLAGATISVKNSLVSTVSDAAGVFSITVPVGAKTLVVTYVGHQPKEISIGNNVSLSVVMATTTSNLNEVVVIGYGNTKRANLTSAQSTVSAKDIEKTVNTTVEQAI